MKLSLHQSPYYDNNLNDIRHIYMNNCTQYFVSIISFSLSAQIYYCLQLISYVMSEFIVVHAVTHKNKEFQT